MDTTPLAALPSRTPDHPLRAALRTDLHYTRMWASSSTGDWYSAADAAALGRAGFISVPNWLAMPPTQAWTKILTARNRENVLRTLAALDQWRTLTVQQLHALTDTDGFARGHSSMLSAMWSVGLVEIAYMNAGLGAGVRNREQILLRPAFNGAAHDRLTRELSVVEMLSVTAGLGFDADRQYTRHNVLAAELALRMAEFGNIRLALGEKLSTLSALTYNPDAPAKGQIHAVSDLVLIRPDGLRVAVELTASTGGGWKGKAERLIRILDAHPLEDSGLIILFLVAPTKGAATTAQKVRQDVQKALHMNSDYLGKPTAARVAVTTWAELFPAVGVANRDLFRLPVDRPLGPGYRGDLRDPTVWRRGFLLDPTDVPFSPTDRARMRRVFAGAAHLRGVPHALRRATDAPLPRRSTRARPSAKGSLVKAMPGLIY